MIRELKVFRTTEVISEAFQIYFGNFLKIMRATVLFFGAPLALAAYIAVKMIGMYSGPAGVPGSAESFLSFLEIMLGIGSWIIYIWYRIVIMQWTRGLYRSSESLRPGAYFPDARRHFWRFFGISFFVGVITSLAQLPLSLVGRTVPLISLANVALVIFLSAGFYFSSISVVQEPIGVGEGLARTWELSKGYKWRIVAVLVIINLIVVLGTGSLFGLSWLIIQIVGIPGWMINTGVANGYFFIVAGEFLILLAVFSPIYTIIKTVLYLSARAEKEGLGLDQVAARWETVSDMDAGMEEM